MIVDCFTFFNEIDLLRVRLAELDPVVDRFVIVEAGQTHSGASKPFNFEAVREHFAAYLPRITYVKLARLPPLVEDNEAARFRLENFNRNAIMWGLIQLDCALDDLVLVSDIDEIPSRAAIDALVMQTTSSTQPLSWTFRQFFHKLYFDETLDDGYNRQWWGGTVAVRYATLSRFSPQQVRREIGGGGQLFDAELCARVGSGVVSPGGWHLSSFGGPAVRDYKLAHYTHGVGRVDARPEGVLMLEQSSENSLPEARDRIAAMIAGTLLGHVPELIREMPMGFRHFFKCAGVSP